MSNVTPEEQIEYDRQQEIIRALHAQVFTKPRVYHFRPWNKLFRAIHQLPVLRNFRFDRNVVGFTAGQWAIYFHSYHFNNEVRLWRLFWRTPRFDNHIHSNELTEIWRTREARRVESQKGSINPDRPTRSRYDRHLNIKYRWLALRHKRNPFASDYWQYTRQF